MNRGPKQKLKRFILVNSIIVSVLIIILVGTIVYFISQDNQSAQKDGVDLLGEAGQTATVIEATPIPVPTPEPTPTPIPYYDATWVGVGDIMSHTPQLPGAYDKASDTYNFDPYFADIKPYLVGDWVMANLETPIAGKDYKNTGYPTFNAPLELADALWNAGFNVLSTANNHSLDKGEKGLLRTLENVKAVGFTTVGTYASEEERQIPVIIEKNNIKMGLLSYTYGTNGIPIPEGKPYLVNLIDKQHIISSIEQLKEAGADVVTIALHFGNEYQTKPTDEQKTLARELIAAGADIIAGSHPHVLQPYELFNVTNEDGSEREGVIFYSMGNFISNQSGDTKDYGGVFTVNLRKHTETGNIEILDVIATPTWVHRYKPDANYRYRILPVEDTLNALDDELLKATDYQQLGKTFEQLTTRLNSMQNVEQ